MQVFKPHYMQKKGDFIWQQRHRVLRTQNGYANTTQYLHLSIDVKIYNQYRNSLREILRRLCEYKGVKIIEGELMADHVHMLVLIPPKISVSSFMGYLKGKSALMMFDKHANLKYKFGNRYFQSQGYYVSTIGLNKATVKKYIHEQELHDQMKDKLSVKEYEGPLRVVSNTYPF